MDEALPRHMVTRLIALALIVSMASLAMVACGSATAAEPTPQPPSPPPPPRAPTVLADTSAGAGAAGGSAAEGTEVVVALEDIGGRYGFAPTDLTFNVGDSITLVLTAETEFHTFTVDELELDVAVSGGETVRHTLTFDKAGTFTLICIPHELLGMVGTITVE